MASPMVVAAVRTVNRAADRQAGANGIERHRIDPASPDGLEPYGLDLLGEGLKTPSRGLHEIPPEAVRAFALHVARHATDTALYADNGRSEGLLSRGHAYLYRGARTRVADDAAAFVDASPNSSMRLCIRAFTNGALELPAGTIDRLRDRMRSGARDGALLRELRSDAQIRAHQAAQWRHQASVVGDVLLGVSSIALVTRQARYALEGGRYVVDMINPATRELHVLDGSTLWLRVLDTLAADLTFAVVGSGRHRFPVMDATNNLGAMSIWHYMSLVQQQLYAGVPPEDEGIAGHIADAVRAGGPGVVRLDRMLRAGDNAPAGAFLRGLRRKHAHENGDAYT